MKVEINWIEGPPTKIGKCLLAIRGSEDAIPAVVGRSGAIKSWTNLSIKYNPESIDYHAAWPTFPRERDERWIECDKRTWETIRGTIEVVHRKTGTGQDEYIGEKHGDSKPFARMEVNMYGHYGVRYFRWPTIREYFDPQEENQKP
jgi:hypothetical protein